MFVEAIEVLRESLPLPAVTGRVCPHFCEAECTRNNIDNPVNIRSLERFIADYWIEEKAEPIKKIYSAKIAIIGSGPAGLSASYQLARMGYPVTVFEALPVLGGMLRIGIPEYRLPKKVLDAQINYIKDTGVEFKTNSAIGKDITLANLKNEGYEAVFIAIGNQLSRKLDIEGTDLDGVLWGLDFLRDVNLKRTVNIKKNVLVIGGGNVAIDVALTALRLGAINVQLACLESRAEMPAYEEEIQQAIDEGVKINASYGPKRIISDDRNTVTGVELVVCTSVLNEAGQFSPSYDEKSTKTIETDIVILAIGQASDLSMIPEDIKRTAYGTIQVDPVTLETTVPGVFFGGDVTSAQGTVVNAIAAGKEAAISIDRFLKGNDLKEGRPKKTPIVMNLPKEGPEEITRQIPTVIGIKDRSGNFNEVNNGFNEEAMILEARRCVTCGSRPMVLYPEDCAGCLRCEFNCPQKCIHAVPERMRPLLAWC
jgi:NADPH-dependent glutamate synthase beta subunit-like oxidoreductase